MFPGEHVKELQFERNVQFYEIYYHVPLYLELNIFAACSTFMTLDGKTRFTIFFPHLIMSSVLVQAGCSYKMTEAGLFINHVIYLCSGG